MVKALTFLLFLVGFYFVAHEYEAYDYSSSPNWHQNKFKNIDAFQLQSFFSFLKWQALRKESKWKVEEIPEEYLIKNPKDKKYKIELTFIGQSTFLIEVNGIAIITDPIFSQEISSFGFDKVERSVKAVPRLEDIKHIEYVFISHNHVDHFDLQSLKQINTLFDPKYIIPLGMGKILEKKLSVKKYQELDWWEKANLTNDIELTLTPAKHWSQTTIFDQFKTLWGGFFLKNKEVSLFFAGDTGYGSHFSLINQKLGSPNISILPIGTYKPEYFMVDSHMNPSEAVKASQQLKSEINIGMHFGTFQESDEGYLEPLVDLKKAKGNLNIQFGVLKRGSSYSF